MSFSGLENITALCYSVENVGKRIKSSKKRHFWRFLVGQQEHTIEMYVGLFSKKRKVLLDRFIVLESALSGQGTAYPIELKGFRCLIHEIKKREFDLRIDNRSFQSLLHCNTGFGFLNEPFRMDPFERNHFALDLCNLNNLADF